MSQEGCDENLSPCIGVCQYNDEDLCRGCFRTSEEISRWFDMTVKEKKRIINLLPSRMEDLF
ncbi:DUF1289 domain-containing protein [Methylophilaceae bacterium]|nr:DUF1289 domain-containing protein [Methylophilaceae bacterium]